jgi:hypothetical protein
VFEPDPTNFETREDLFRARTVLVYPSRDVGIGEHNLNVGSDEEPN